MRCAAQSAPPPPPSRPRRFAAAAAPPVFPADIRRSAAGCCAHLCVHASAVRVTAASLAGEAAGPIQTLLASGDASTVEHTLRGVHCALLTARCRHGPELSPRPRWVLARNQL